MLTRRSVMGREYLSINGIESEGRHLLTPASKCWGSIQEDSSPAGTAQLSMRCAEEGKDSHSVPRGTPRGHLSNAQTPSCTGGMSVSPHTLAGINLPARRRARTLQTIHRLRTVGNLASIIILCWLVILSVLFAKDPYHSAV